MTGKVFWSVLRALAVTLCTASLALAQSATLDAPDSVRAGATVEVRWTGPKVQYDLILVVEAGAPEGTRPGRESVYINSKGKPVTVRTPEKAGAYEIRYQAAKSRATLARRPLTLTPVSATLTAPDSVVGGATVSVKFVGPNNQYDRIAIVPAGTPEGSKPGRYYSFTVRDGTVSVVAPEEPGAYEIRYLTSHESNTLGRSPLTITAAGATLSAPATALAGATVSVKFVGPNNQYDRIAIVPVGTPNEGQKTRYYSFTNRKGMANVRSPEQPGEYEIRYVTRQSGTTLGSVKLTLTALSASLQAPASVTAGTNFKVQWQGPANDYDHISIAQPGSEKDTFSGRFYLRRGPVSVRAPLEVGEYELRYCTGALHTILATAKVQVTPAKEEPGSLRVTKGTPTAGGSGGGGGAGNAVEVILDASGSMLQRIGSERRIDIAKRTLQSLVSETIPAGTPFALRVFGREADSCQTDLDIPLSPLDVAGASAKVNALEAKANAKTPIGASLDQVASDLASVKGDRVVVLVTDGEETCDGDPAAAIARLTKGGANVRVNIVGFAIDDSALATTFEHWSQTGNGAYFEARDAAELQRALSAALQPTFEVLDSKSQVVASGVANGDALPLLPGKYTVRPKGSKGESKSATVRAKQTTTVAL